MTYPIKIGVQVWPLFSPQLVGTVSAIRDGQFFVVYPGSPRARFGYPLADWARFGHGNPGYVK
jgi:hypothetical protein